VFVAPEQILKLRISDNNHNVEKYYQSLHSIEHGAVLVAVVAVEFVAEFLEGEAGIVAAAAVESRVAVPISPGFCDL